MKRPSWRGMAGPLMWVTLTAVVFAATWPAVASAAESSRDALPRDSRDIEPFTVGQRIDPNNFRCEDFIPRQAPDAARGNSGTRPAVITLSWQQTVEVENCDRIKRLATVTLAAEGAQPVFYIQRVPGDKLPPGFPDIPMLRVIFPQNVFFDTDRSTLRPEAEELVNLIASVLRTDIPDVTLFVAGHTDSDGNRDYNQNLSVDRANSVAAQLLALDVGLAHVWRIGFGEDMPLMPNTDEVAMGHNRRVEFLFAAKPEAISQWLADMQLDGLCQGISAEDTQQCKQRLTLKPQYDVGEIDILADPNAEIVSGNRVSDIAAVAQAAKPINVKNKQGQTITVRATPKQTISIYPHSRTTSITINR